MLIEFSVNNFRSIKGDLTLNMLSTGTNAAPLSSVVLYGANASGKSNVLGALRMMRAIVLNEGKVMLSTDELPYNPFRLASDSEKAPTCFDVVFEQDSKKYKYGFSYDSGKIYSEYLMVYESNRPTTIYEYEQQNGFKPNSKLTALKKFSQNPNMLCLWEVDRRGVEYAKIVLKWFKDLVCVTFDSENGLRGAFSSSILRFFDDPSKKALISAFVHSADMGIKDVRRETLRNLLKGNKKSDDLNSLVVEYESIQTVHDKFDKRKKRIGEVAFDLFEDESTGSKKLFIVMALMLDALMNGNVLLLDEMDASLHPLLTRKLVEIFKDSALNKKNAQLVFTSQDTNLLDMDLFKKEQVYFVEKNAVGETSLVSLVDYANVRSEKIEKNYILGKFGAIPNLGSFEFLNEV